MRVGEQPGARPPAMVPSGLPARGGSVPAGPIPKAPVQWMLGRARPLLQGPGGLPVALKDPKQPRLPFRAPHSSYTGPLCPPGVRLRPRAWRSFRVECCPRSVWPRSSQQPLLTGASTAAWQGPRVSTPAGCHPSPTHTRHGDVLTYVAACWVAVHLRRSAMLGPPGSTEPRCRGEGWQGESSQTRVRGGATSGEGRPEPPPVPGQPAVGRLNLLTGALAPQVWPWPPQPPRATMRAAGTPRTWRTPADCGPRSQPSSSSLCSTAALSPSSR